MEPTTNDSSSGSESEDAPNSIDNQLANLSLEDQVVKLKEIIAYKNETIKYWKREWQASERFINNIHGRLNQMK
jgi:hypothetical protein